MCGGCWGGGPGRIWGAVCVGSAQQCGAAVGGGQSSAAVCCVCACLEDGAELLRTPAHVLVSGGLVWPLCTRGWGAAAPQQQGSGGLSPGGGSPPGGSGRREAACREGAERGSCEKWEQLD